MCGQQKQQLGALPAPPAEGNHNFLHTSLTERGLRQYVKTNGACVFEATEQQINIVFNCLNYKQCYPS